jgi:hypothetical protein
MHFIAANPVSHSACSPRRALTFQPRRRGRPRGSAPARPRWRLPGRSMATACSWRSPSPAAARRAFPRSARRWFRSTAGRAARAARARSQRRRHRRNRDPRLGAAGARRDAHLSMGPRAGEFVPVDFTDDRDRTNKFLVVDATGAGRSCTVREHRGAVRHHASRRPQELARRALSLERKGIHPVSGQLTETGKHPHPA